jgi:hypothetical protein
MTFGERLELLRSSLTSYFDRMAADPDATADQIPPHVLTARFMKALEAVTGHAATVMETAVIFIDLGQPEKAAEVLKLAIADHREKRPKGETLQ